MGAYPTKPGHPLSPIVIEIDDAKLSHKIFGEIEVYLPNRCLHLDQCLKGTPGGVCPSEGKKFISGEPVLIIKEDFDSAIAGKPIKCISATGIRKLVAFQRIGMQEDSFVHKDPFGRESNDKDSPLVV